MAVDYVPLRCDRKEFAPFYSIDRAILLDQHTIVVFDNVDMAVVILSPELVFFSADAILWAINSPQVDLVLHFHRGISSIFSVSLVQKFQLSSES